MFAFHKPKVFRSANGCCICGAKSSSSRFTDSKRYEASFDRCFDLDGEIRVGEICNACVLLVKRFIKLPEDTDKNWNHVVDARSGPGIKSMVRGKNNNKNSYTGKHNVDSDGQDMTPEKPLHKRKHVYRSKKSNIRNINKDIRNNNISSLQKMKHPKKQPIGNIRRLNDEQQKMYSNLSIDERHKQRRAGAGGFLNESMWKKQEICCGYIFIGPNGEFAVDQRYLQRCDACKLLKEPLIPSTVLSAAQTLGAIRFRESMVNGDDFSEAMSIASGDDESAEEECDSLAEEKSVSSPCSSQSEDTVRAAKLAFDVESEVTEGASAITTTMHSERFQDEGFYDNNIGSPNSDRLSRASSPPLSDSLMMPHGLHPFQSPPLLRGGTT